MIEFNTEADLDGKITDAFRQVSEKLAERSENMETTQGYAIIGRYFLEDGKPRGIEKVRLVPGECAVFLKNGGVDRFNQIDMVEKLDVYCENPDFETFAYVDLVNGSLFFGNGEVRKTISRETPLEERILNAGIGKMNYGIVWGENKIEAEATLCDLINQRFGCLN